MRKGKKRVRKAKKKKNYPLLAGKPLRELQRIYKTMRTGIRGALIGKNVLPDLTVDLSPYEDNREPVFPGKTIKNEFRKYPWQDSSYDSVKG
ncbi:hypothetical protein MYG64_06925 [Ensifer adhaerens]|uniref:hypothetical protein n=1 Tax=Ensifer adhaerens TaxID=106592 RepID=UPI002100CC66|nr:hypothetical protein [Ensifer adhaerens]UTV38023.1 hypothetical protein MYG64_06925 [Ensifer adhaerens]